MLMRFSVANFMSFPYKTDSQGRIVPSEFTMYAGRTEHFRERIIHFNKRKVLKFASVYGANAAGKSNLIKAMDCGRDIIMGNIDAPGMKNLYCRCDMSNQEKPTFFEYEFTIDARCYAYGFTVNLWKGEVLTEWLVELDDDDERTIFERDVKTSQYYFDETCFLEQDNIQQFHFFLKDVNRIPNSLLLYELKRRKLEGEDFELYQKLYGWFQKKLVIIYPDTPIGESYFRFSSDKQRLIQILKYLDTGITGYSMKKLNESAFREYFTDDALADRFLKRESQSGKVKRKGILRYQDTLFEVEFDGDETPQISKLLFQHGKSEALYEYGEESDGTHRLIELLEIIVNDDEEKTFVIDELDRSLHPQMTRKFMETFFKFSEQMKTQLITTTHESNLMDLELLRRDEIWFAERRADHSTALYPMEQFKIRYDKVIAKDYLAGRYGAVPVFQDFAYVWGREMSGETEFENSEVI